jgi:membrane protein CcdC involved in cytochrome C biogenesis
MLALALFFLAAGVLVLRFKRPMPRPYGSREYRVDERAISGVLFLLATCMIVLEVAVRLRGAPA